MPGPSDALQPGSEGDSDASRAGSERTGPASTDLERTVLERTALEESPALSLVLLDDAQAVCLLASGGESDSWLHRADVEGQSFLDITHPCDVPVLLAALQTARRGSTVAVGLRLRLPGRPEQRCELEVRKPVRRPGRPLLVGVLRRARGPVQGGSATGSEHADPATGLPTRAVLTDRVQQALRRLERRGEHVALLFVDLDRFKAVNDTLGHTAGDTVLWEVSARLSRVLRPEDTLARVGGDEFAVLLEALDGQQQALALAERVVRVGRRPVTVDGQRLLCTMSVGVAVTDDPQHPVEELLHEADMAMYRAKAGGRDRVEVFDEPLRRASKERRATEQVLRRALDEDGLLLEYQPVVSVPGGELVSVEALLRVDAGDRGVLRPAAFLEVAATSGLLHRLDLWALESAVQQAAQWLRQDPALVLPVSLNLGGRDLESAAFSARLVTLLREAGVPPSLLRLEVTERVLSRATPAALGHLRRLREAGVQVGLDDFGTAPSSVGCLEEYPLDFVKIDGTVVAALSSRPVAHALAGAVVQVGHALGLRVVAEGVESPEQLEVLAALGCDEAQGHLWGGSTRAADVLALGGSAVGQGGSA